MSASTMRAADFIESIGVNAHIDQAGSTYAKSDVIGQMRYLGIDNMRVLAPYDQAGTLSTYTSLGQQGIKFDVVPFVNHGAAISLANDMSLIDSIAPYVRTVEGPNEINTDPLANYNGLSGVDAAIALQKDLYAAVHSDARLNGVSVLGFSLSVGGSVTGFGDISQYADYANVHGYAGQGVPPYYMLDYARTSITTVTGKPVMMTETGNYTDFDGNTGVTEDVQAKWIMDSLLENASKGVAKTYVYQLEDNGFDTGAPYSENHYGMFNNDGTAKQSAVDVHNLTTILADTGSNAATFVPTALNYTVSGVNTDNTFNSSFAKSNGVHDIALWYEPQFYNAATGQASGVAAQNATVALGGTYNVKVFDPVAGTTAIASYQNVSSVNVALGTDPLIIEVSPTGTTTPITTPITVPPVTTGVTPLPPITTTTSAAVTLGSGSSSIVVGVSEDAFQGNAQFTVSVDGTQVGDTQTATASHAAGKSQAFTLLGNWAAGAHTVAVSFLNDLYGGGGTADRNLYVDGVTAGGTTVPGAPLYGNGTQSFTATLPPPPVVVAPPPPPTVMTLGSGSSSIVVGVSEDAFQGNAQFTVSVDGTQVGGTQTATASHAAGNSQAFTLKGNWATGAHTVAVSFLNDLYGGGGTADRNLYVDGVTAGGTTVPGAPLYGNGTQSFTATLPPPPVVVVPPPPPMVMTLGSGSSSIVVGVSEDAYQGDAQFTVSVDGTQVGGTQTATASHAAGKSQAFTLLGNWAAGAHTVAVSFLNDLYGGGGTADRNLYVDGVTAGGTTVPGAPLYGNGTQSFTATLTSSVTTIGSGAGSITLGVSEDAYQGDAQFTVSVDGTQIGGTQTATASHAAGKSQVFNVLGAFGAGPHSVSVNFLNDAWGGTAATDRNLYVDSFTAGGVTKPVGLALMAPGSQSFTTPAVIGPATLGSNPTLAFVTAAKAVTIDGGTAAGKTLTGGTARDVFVLHAGTSNGDTITNFKPSLTAGDFLELKGYGTGATLTQVDTTTWTANSASGAIHDVIKLTNAAALVPANVLFA